MTFAIRNLIFFTFFLFLPVVSQALEVEEIAITREGNGELLTIRLDAAVKHKAFALKGPHRLVIDLPPFQWDADIAKLASSKSRFAKRVRYARFDASTSRIVLDMNTAIRFEEVGGVSGKVKQFRLTAKAGATSSNVGSSTKGSTSMPWNRRKGKSRPPAVVSSERAQNELPTSRASKRKSHGKKLIVIDAGHGGKDSGAIGKKKTQEKHVTLRYARALKKALEKTGYYRVKLTRDKDKIIPLRERFRIARRQKADLFLSLHADSAPNAKARGFSVYTLSEKASDKEAAALAKQENKVDLLLDVELQHEDEEVAGILIDLARRETKNKSVKFAQKMVKSMRGVKLLKNPHRHAGFAVLKAPDIPSVLVEIGFLSHAQEERLMNQKEHQDKVVNGIKKAIGSYFGR